MKVDERPAVLDHAAWLVERRRGMDDDECAWLDVLAEFDAAEGWRADGQLCGADWLMWRCRLSRSSAYEKLRVAHALRRRPALAAAYAAGRVGYSAVRAISRLEDPSPAVVEALIALAEHGTVGDVERAVRASQLIADEDAPDPSERWSRRGVRLSRGLNGHGTLTAVVSDVELEELGAALDAFIDRSAAEAVAQAGPVDARRDASTGSLPWWTRRADALMELVRVGLAHAKDGHAVGADRYLVHAVVDVASQTGRLIDGTPLDQGVVARICCDASAVLHVTDRTTPLAVGRKQRAWSEAQRRAISVRDGGRCRFPGCGRTIADIHHVRPWEHGGATDVSNGALLCARHHTLVHHGFGLAGDANGDLRFTRPDGSLIALSAPPAPPGRLPW